MGDAKQGYIRHGSKVAGMVHLYWVAQAHVRRLLCGFSWLSAIVIAAALTSFSPSPAASAEPGSECRAPSDLVKFASPLPVLHNVMATETQIRIAALGSSSTQGVGASSKKMCYPARLEEELNHRHGSRLQFTVSNLGVGGELATDMLARLDTEVLPLKPHLVVWQTGVNDAIVGFSLDDFRTTLVQGVSAIRAAGADVVLMGMQYYPKASRVEMYKDYLKVMRDIAVEMKVPILNRYGIMKYLLDTAQYTPAQLFAPDQFHQNDVSYGCMGRLLAEAIDDAVKPAAHRAAESHVGTGAHRAVVQ